MADYGVLTELVDDIGALIAASTAIMLSFKGRQQWEPSEEDIPKGPVKIVGVLTAVGVGLLYYWASQLRYNEDTYYWIAIVCASALVLGFLAYVILITVYTYERQVAVSGEVQTDKIIGGFWLTGTARKVQQERPETKNIQRLLRGAAFNVDDVWPRVSRALAKVSFLLSYFTVIIGGCLALAAVAIMLDKLP